MQPQFSSPRLTHKILANLLDVFFVTVLLVGSFGLSYASAKVFERIAGREISPSSALELSVVLVPWAVTIIYSRYLYLYRIKARMGILKDLGFLKSKQRKTIMKPST